MIESALSEVFTQLIATPKWICLSSVNAHGIPETRAMMNLANPEWFPTLQAFFGDGFTTYFSTNTSSEKVQQFIQNPNASVYYYDEEIFQGLLLTGEITIVADTRIKNAFWQDDWLMYYTLGVNDPDYTLLKFHSRAYKYYNGNYEVKSGAL